MLVPYYEPTRPSEITKKSVLFRKVGPLSSHHSVNETADFRSTSASFRVRRLSPYSSIVISPMRDNTP